MEKGTKWSPARVNSGTSTIYYLCKQSISSSIFMFADDTKFICSINSVYCWSYSILQADLDCLLKWCERWQLNFNIFKCKLIHYRKNHEFGEYYMNGHPLTSVDHHKDLGVMFDCFSEFPPAYFWSSLKS